MQYKMLEMDGEIEDSTNTNHTQRCVFITVAFITILLVFWNLSDIGNNRGTIRGFRDNVEYLTENGVRNSDQFKAFYECAFPKVSQYRGNPEQLWANFDNATKECDEVPLLKSIDLRPVKNKDETKWIAYPKENENLTMVTLGIGKDTSGETKLKELYNNIDFFGADPSQEINKDLYLKLGAYFPVAISESAGMKVSRVFRKIYENEVTLHIGAGYFFNDMIRRKRIDILWLDTEGNEYTFVDLLPHDEELDKRGVTICQINIEMHLNVIDGWNGEKKKFHDFLFKLLADGRYIMMRPHRVGFYDFLRVVVLNVEHDECRRLFI